MSKRHIIIGVIVTQFAVAGWMSRSLIRDRPILTVSQLDIEIDGTILSEDDVLRVLGVHDNNLSSLASVRDIRNSILEFPQVEAVEVTRQLPSTIQLRIALRKPVVRLLAERTFFVLDSHASAFVCDDPMVEDLPSFRLVPPPGELDFLNPGEGLETMYRTAAFMALQTGAIIHDYRLIDGSTPGELILRNESGGSLIRLGYRDIDNQLLRLDSYLAHDAAGPATEYDLRFPSLMILRSSQREAAHG